MLLVDGPPQVVSLAPDLHEDLIQVPHVAESTVATSERLGVFGSELPAPLPHRLIADNDAPLREEFLDIAKAQAESMAQPHAVADELTREAVTVVADLVHLHLPTLPTSASS